MKGPGGKGIVALEALLCEARRETEKEMDWADREQRRANELAARVQGLQDVARGTAADTLALAKEMERRGTYQELEAEVRRLAAKRQLLAELLAHYDHERARLATENTRLRGELPVWVVHAHEASEGSGIVGVCLSEADANCLAATVKGCTPIDVVSVDRVFLAPEAAPASDKSAFRQLPAVRSGATCAESQGTGMGTGARGRCLRCDGRGIEGRRCAHGTLDFDGCPARVKS